MSVTFKAPDGGDPVKYTSRIFEELSTIPDTRLKKLGDNILEKIRARTADGMSFNGGAFAPYNPGYAFQKNSTQVDLYGYLSDEHMMDDLEVRVKTNPAQIQIGIFSHAGKASLAQLHNEGSHSSIGPFERNGKVVGPFLRRRKIRGLQYKGGRAVKGLLFKGFTTKTVQQKLKSIREHKFVSSQKLTLGLGFRSKSVANIVNRVAVRSKRRLVITQQFKDIKVRVPVFEKGRTHRNPVKTVIPARPFLGLTQEDQEFVARNIIPPTQRNQ